MSVATGVLTWEALAAAIEAAGEYATIQEAINAGIIIVGDQAVTGLTVIEGGAAVATYSSVDSALALAQASDLLATGAKVTTGGATLFKTATGFKLAGLMTLDVGMTSAICAPLAGFSLGANLYQANPQLWTKISQTLLPFCYAENKIQAFVDFVKDPLTSEYSPIVTIPTAIIDALKKLFQDEKVHTDDVTFYEYTDSLGRTVGTSSPPVESGTGLELVSVNGSPQFYGTTYEQYGVTRYILHVIGSGSATYARPGAVETYTSGNSYDNPNRWNVPYTTYADPEAIINDPQADIGTWPPTAGVSAPTVPVEPIVWPDTPIIVVPDPLGPDYQPIPVTPVTPLPLPPAPDTPLLPEHVPDPAPEAPPEEWPEEEPWPTVIPAPWTEPGTEPTPETPYIPWPLPETKPDEDDPKPDYWPNYPPAWPATYPEELPWAESPQEWPTIVPWPELEPGTEPDWWPDEEPWPASPQEWPDDVPWPMPPEWPFPWPSELPYPWPFPYPDASPDPYPDPETIEEPKDQVDPYIDPWPVQWPNPYQEPPQNSDPYRDPSQPAPKPEYEPSPNPDDPYPTPPSGDPTPPLVPIIPLPFSSTTGLITVYHPTQAELLAFCNWLWITWQDATIDKIWNNPFDGIITLFELYCTPTDVGTKHIRSGFLDSGVSSQTISRYTEINCGSIGVPEYFGNYLDYAPYSKCHIYLPFIGIIELNVDDIVGHGVNVTYRIDEYNGSCIALITVAKSTTVNGTDVEYSTVMYQFSGNCAVDLPIAGGSQAAIKAGMLEAAAWGIGSVVGGIMSGSSPLSIGAGMAYGAASAVHSLVSAKSSVQHSGSFGSSFGALGSKIPYIIVTRPKQIQVPNYNELYGYQAHKMVRIGDCDGYIRCREVHVVSPTASDEEKAQIEQLLKLGVYVTDEFSRREDQ